MYKNNTLLKYFSNQLKLNEEPKNELFYRKMLD